MKRVLVVDDEKENVELLTRYLSDDGHIVQSASDGESALHRVRAWKPHLVLLDINMPGISGLDLIPKIRVLAPEEYVSIVLVSSNMTMDDVKRGLEAGADDYLTKPFRSQELITRVHLMSRFKEAQDALKRATHRVDELSSTDDLTGLLNTRSLFRRGEDEISRSRRFRKPISAVLVNLDGFGLVNQNHGFPFGSQLLQQAGEAIRRCVRPSDLVARLGADEYFILLSDTDLAGAEFTAERVRDAIQSATFKNEKQSARVTASVGVAGFGPDHWDTGSGKVHRMADLVHFVSEALRSAKSNGPNRIEIYSFA